MQLLKKADLSSHEKMYVAWALGVAGTDELDGFLKGNLFCSADDRVRLGVLRGLYPYRRPGIFRPADLSWYEQNLATYIKGRFESQGESRYDRDTALNLACKLQIYSPTTSRFLSEAILARGDLTVTLLANAPDQVFFSLVASLATSHPSESVRHEAAVLLGDGPGVTRVHHGYIATIQSKLANEREINSLNLNIFGEFCAYARDPQGYACSLSPAEAGALDDFLSTGGTNQRELVLATLRKMDEAVTRAEASYADMMVPTIAGLLEGSDPSIKSNLLRSMNGALVDRPALKECLWKTLEKDPDPEVRKACVEALGWSQNPVGLSEGLFRVAEQDPAWEVRTAAVYRLLAGTSRDNPANVERTVGIVRRAVRSGSISEKAVNDLFDTLHYHRDVDKIHDLMVEFTSPENPEFVRNAAARALKE